MTDNDNIKKELEEQLEKVKKRLQILDMIDEKLLHMRKLAQRVVYEDLNNEEIHEINKKVQNLEEQVKLLDSESTRLS